MMTEPHRLSAADFLREIEMADRWAVMMSGATSNLELWTCEKDGGPIVKFAGPDFLTMPGLEIGEFLTNIRRVCQAPEVWVKRFLPHPIGQGLPEMLMEDVQQDPPPENM
jgi:hypothetical protein